MSPFPEQQNVQENSRKNEMAATAYRIASDIEFENSMLTTAEELVVGDCVQVYYAGKMYGHKYACYLPAIVVDWRTLTPDITSERMIQADLGDHLIGFWFLANEALDLNSL